MNWYDLFRYDPDTGKLFWKHSRGRVKAGQEAGATDVRGYIVLRVNYIGLKAHRVIWDMCHPDDPLTPEEQIDHINHKLGDNRIVNLRKVDSTDNHRNMSKPKNNSSGVSGVCWDNNRGKWKAAIQLFGVTKNLGRFDSFESAVAARKDAEGKYGFHENHGATNEN